MTIIAPTPIADGPAVPDSSQPEASFDSQFEAYNTWEKTVLLPGMNALGANVYGNALETKTNAEAAIAAASSAQIMSAFKGLWSALTGPLLKPATVLENGAYWMLLQDLADVTIVRPGTNAAVWTPQILEARNLGAVDLRTVVNSGDFYVAGALTNAPPGVNSALVNVKRYGTVAVQTAHDTVAGSTWICMGSALTTVPVWTAWGRVSQDNTPGIALAGGAMDCSKGTYFTETVNGARTLSFTNIPAGAYACVLEINHTSGTITPPTGSVWVAGAPPTLTTARRHLFFFQRALTGSGGWILSALPNSAL